MEHPEDLRYTAEHEWVRVLDGRVRVGITDYAQDAIGDVVFVDLPEVGRSVDRGEVVCEIESTKSVSEIYAPVGGTLAAVNDALDASPDLVNRAPYGEGWIFELEPTETLDPEHLDEVEGLLDAATYESLLEE